MKILVCIRPDPNGELSPFEMSAYEMALRIPGSEVMLLSMASPTSRDLLLNLTRLGARSAFLLCDPLLAGSDTLATAYALSQAVKTIRPDMVFCGRKTLVGDTAQVPPMLAEYCSCPYVANVTDAEWRGDGLYLTTRAGNVTVGGFSVLSVEKSMTLRRPRLTSKVGELTLLSAAEIHCSSCRIGLKGSATRLVSSFENPYGKRKCRFLPREAFRETLRSCLAEHDARETAADQTDVQKLHTLSAFGSEAADWCAEFSEAVHVIPAGSSLAAIVSHMQTFHPQAVVFPSNDLGRELAARLSVRESLGLCADCTRLETDGRDVFMIRPALGGTVLAKVRATTAPALCTVRTSTGCENRLCIGVGYGARDAVDFLSEFARQEHGQLAASRKLVDQGYLPYENQVGLTGKVVAPQLYLAVGISGAVQHIVGMDKSRRVIAVNPDRNAAIFEFADYGFLMSAEELKTLL